MQNEVNELSRKIDALSRKVDDLMITIMKARPGNLSIILMILLAFVAGAAVMAVLT